MKNVFFSVFLREFLRAAPCYVFYHGIKRRYNNAYISCLQYDLSGRILC